MTFHQFVTTKRHVADLETALKMSIYDDPDIKCPGFIYGDSLYIEERNDNWPESSKEAGKFYLQCGDWDCVTDDLDALERKLYDFAVGVGWI